MIFANGENLPWWVTAITVVGTAVATVALTLYGALHKIRQLRAELTAHQNELDSKKRKEEADLNAAEDEQASRRESGVIQRYKRLLDNVTEERAKDLVRYQGQLDMIAKNIDRLQKDHDDCKTKAAAQEVEIQWLKREVERLGKTFDSKVIATNPATKPQARE